MSEPLVVAPFRLEFRKNADRWVARMVPSPALLLVAPDLLPIFLLSVPIRCADTPVLREAVIALAKQMVTVAHDTLYQEEVYFGDETPDPPDPGHTPGHA